MDPLKKKLLNQHSKYLSRRDFVSLGLTAAGGFVFAPTFFHSLKRAQAFAEGLPFASNNAVPFITFDLSGGAGLVGNFLVGGAGGAQDLLPSYSTLGWNPRTAGIDTRFGLPMPKGDISKILTGMLSVMSAGAQANFRMASILHVGRDDTSDNPLSIAHLVSSAGSTGTTIGAGIGMTRNSSGGNSRSVKEIPDFACKYISSVTDLLQANSVSQPLSAMGKGFIAKIFSQVHSMSMKQAALALPGDTQTLTTLDARLSGSEVLAVSESNLDPRINTATAAIYGLTANTAPASQNALRGGLVLGAVSGATGPAVITIGGCDYHDGSQSSGDTKDQEIGIEIGRAVETAFRLKRPLFIHIVTDGGIASSENSRNWQGDNGEKSMSIMGYFNPDHVPSYIDSNKVQAGAYTNGQGADRSTFFGASSALAGYSVFANYLNVCGRMADWDTLSGRAISTNDLSSVLLFNS